MVDCDISIRMYKTVGSEYEFFGDGWQYIWWYMEEVDKIEDGRWTKTFIQPTVCQQ